MTKINKVSNKDKLNTDDKLELLDNNKGQYEPYKKTIWDKAYERIMRDLF